LQKFYTPPSEFVNMFDAYKTRMIGLPYCEKNYDNMLLERDGRTDGHNSYISIARQYADVR